MRKEMEITRRKLLGGIMGIGAAGAVGGGGVRSLLNSRDDLPANVVGAGSLDMEVCWQDTNDDCDPVSDFAEIDIGGLQEIGDGGSATVRCRLPESEGDGVENNPSWIWLRTNCPTDACGIERKVSLTVWYDEGCDSGIDSEENIIRQGRMCDVLKDLHSGTLLDAEPFEKDGDNNTPQPLEPGSDSESGSGDLCIGVRWEVTDEICTKDEAGLSLEFKAQQTRHSPDPVSPWKDAVCEVDCDSDCVDCLDLKSLSFVAFCSSEEIRADDVSMEVVARNYSFEPVSVYWESDVEVGCVVTKSGRQIQSSCDAGTSGTVSSGSDSGETRTTSTSISPSSPCRGERKETDWVKYDFDDSTWETSPEGGNNQK
ncbi:MAG: hypothetical protein SV253_02780 [Halobacteria archaeon]|nr:hypothetical protein [Halobacteria archaeon]